MELKASGVLLRIFVIGLLVAFLFPQRLPAQEDGAMVVETEIGYDQILEDRKLDSIKAAIPMVKSTKETASERVEAESNASRIGSEQIIRLNSSLRRSIEENAALTEKKENLERDLGQARGQRNIQANRVISLGEERDRLQRQLEETEALKTTIGMPITEYYALMQEKEAEFKKQIEDLQAKVVAAETQMKSLQDERLALTQRVEGLTVAMAEAKKEGKVFEKTDVLIAEYQLQVETLKDRLAEAERKARELGEERSALTLTIEDLKARAAATPEGPSPKLAKGQLELESLPGRMAEAEERVQGSQAEKQALDVASGQPEGTSGVETVVAVSELPRPGEAAEAARTVGETGQQRYAQAPQTIPEEVSLHATVISAAAEAEDEASGKPALQKVVKVHLEEEASGAREKSLAVIELLEKLDQEAERLKIDEAKVHYNMGNTFFNQGKYRRAVREYHQAIKLMPKDANAHFNLAYVSGEYLRDTRTALKHYKEYLSLRPNAEDAALVKEKIVEAELLIRSVINTSLEGDWKRHERRLYQE